MPPFKKTTTPDEVAKSFYIWLWTELPKQREDRFKIIYSNCQTFTPKIEEKNLVEKLNSLEAFLALVAVTAAEESLVLFNLFEKPVAEKTWQECLKVLGKNSKESKQRTNLDIKQMVIDARQEMIGSLDKQEALPFHSAAAYFLRTTGLAKETEFEDSGLINPLLITALFEAFVPLGFFKRLSNEYKIKI